MGEAGGREGRQEEEKRPHPSTIRTCPSLSLSSILSLSLASDLFSSRSRSQNTTYTHAPKYDQISSVSGGGGGAGETSQAQQKRTREMERLKKMKKLLADARTAERL